MICFVYHSFASFSLIHKHTHNNVNILFFYVTKTNWQSFLQLSLINTQYTAVPVPVVEGFFSSLPLVSFVFYCNQCREFPQSMNLKITFIFDLFGCSSIKISSDHSYCYVFVVKYRCG